MLDIEIKKLRPGAVTPARGSAYAAGYDLYACIDAPVAIAPGETATIGTGISCAIPEGWFGACFARSGLATKQGLRPANCVGVVDSDYRGEYFIALHNDSAETRTIENGERIAQLVFMPFAEAQFTEVSELSETDRGAGGFGSTGK